MDKHPLTDRSFLLPIGIGVFSILGILVSLLIVYLDKPEAVTPVPPTLTRLQYTFLGTETSTPDPALEITPSKETIPEESTPIDTPQIGLVTPSLSTPTPTRVQPTSTPSASPTAIATLPTLLKKYDDTDPLLDYDGSWISETSVGNTYQGTLFVSNTIGNDLIFSFTGRQIVLGYVGEAGLGSMNISIDDREFQLDQSSGREWVSPQLSNAEHFVIILHESGESVNLDYINVLTSN